MRERERERVFSSFFFFSFFLREREREIFLCVFSFWRAGVCVCVDRVIFEKNNLCLRTHCAKV